MSEIKSTPRLSLRVRLGVRVLPLRLGKIHLRFVKTDKVNNTTSAFVVCDFVFMKSSTSDKIKGTFKEARGKAKEKLGEATGNPDQRDRGTAEKVGGKVQRKIGDVKKVFGQ